MSLRMHTREASSTPTLEKESMEGALGVIRSLANFVNEHVSHDRKPREKNVSNNNHMIERF